MAVLPDSDRDDIHRIYEDEEFNILRKQTTLSRQDLRAAVNATDTWIDDNQASFNAAIPQPARAALTVKQKVRLMVFVAQRRYKVEV